jgi:hypothetical protein
VKVVVGFAFPRADGLNTAGNGVELVRLIDPTIASVMMTMAGHHEFESAVAAGHGGRGLFQFGKIVEPPSCFSLSPRLREDLALMHLLGLAESLPIGTVVRPHLPPPTPLTAELRVHVLSWTIEIVGPN